MAYPTSMIMAATEGKGSAASTPRKQRNAAQSRANASFARLMDAQEAKASTAQARPAAASSSRSGPGAEAVKKPTVARLPDNSTLSLRNTVLAGRSPSDMARAQVYSAARTDLQKTRLLESLAQGISGGNSALEAARNLGTARNLRNIAASGKAGLPLSPGDIIRTSGRVRSAQRSRAAAKKQTVDNASPAGSLGKLSARFESGSDGIAAIGYDRTGGTSYGKYQIASRVGSMASFLKFLDGEAPDLASRLRSAGPANTGSRRGAMPEAWKAIAREDPQRFEQLQEAFIRQTHYDPAVASITRRTGLEAGSLSPAMREVIWSTAVQHGAAGAARIFDRADSMSGSPQDAAYERKLISNVYAVRSGQFGSSSSDVQAAVRNRFRQEKAMALNMLDGSSRANRA